MTPKQLEKLLDRIRITDGRGFRLRDHDPADTGGRLVSRADQPALLAAGVARLSELQALLYAEHSWSLLCVFQAMDAAGKDGTIKHVMSGVNPQGVQVTSFRAPGPEALDHDFLWRSMQEMPERGRIGIFNRSHYEEVLVVRVHPDVLARERLPKRLVTKHIWRDRLEDISCFERYLARQGTVILKFFLHLSKAEQKRRFFERMDHADKNWKLSGADVAERGYWDDYMAAYQHAIAATASKHAPWYVVPADHKWFSHLMVVSAMVEALEGLGLRTPKLSADEQQRLTDARHTLEAET